MAKADTTTTSNLPLTPAHITGSLMVSPLPVDDATAPLDADTIVAFVTEGFMHAVAAPLFRHTYRLDPTKETATATQVTQSMFDHLLAEVAGAARGARQRVCVCEIDQGTGRYVYAPVIAAYLLAALSGLPFDHVWATYVLPAVGDEATITPAQRDAVQLALSRLERFAPTSADALSVAVAPAPEASAPEADES